MGAIRALSTWSSRRRRAAAAGAVAVMLAVGLPTDVIPNPVFGRPVDVTWWSYPQLALTAVLGGLLLATYVVEPNTTGAVRGGAGAGAGAGVEVRAGVRAEMEIGADVEIDAAGRAGGVGGLLSFFAVGCPTCNKLAVVALGSSGALDWFAPAQPLLAVGSLLLLVWALRTRLSGEVACLIAPGSGRGGNMGR